MVRKRSRKYESSDENDSDSDTEFGGGGGGGGSSNNNNSNKASSPPAAKRYSLRERRAPPPEFDFFGLADEDDDDDVDGDATGPNTKQQSSDDEDFEIDLKKNKRKQKDSSRHAGGDDDDDDDFSDNEVETLPYKSCDTTLESTTQNGLIDFEDIIRADIVVRKKVDYDNLIEKSTICLNSDKQLRDRKPKNFYNENNDEIIDEHLNIFEPHIETHTQNDDDDDGGGNDLLNLATNITTDSSVPNLFINKSNIEENLNKIEKNGTDSQQVCNKQNIEENLNGGSDGGGGNKIEDDEDDDVIVLGELKQDIIVLDD